MRALLKQIMPPFLWGAVRRLTTMPPPVCATYEEAAWQCRQSGYEDDALVRAVVEKNLVFRKKIRDKTVFDLAAMRTLIALGLSRTSNELKVIDFGGGAGYHYEMARAALGQSAAIRWNVVETTAMANAARSLEEPGLKFFDSIEEAARDLGAVDLVLASSSLQYCPDPMLFLQCLINVGAGHLFITRTPFSESPEDVISVQRSRLSANGPGPLPAGFTDVEISYPITYLSTAKVEKALSSKYELRFKVEEELGAFLAGSRSFNMWGYFSALRK